MRLFIAVPLPTAVARDVRDHLSRLRERNWPVRWVRDAGLHVTLKFFGEVTTDRVDAIVELLDLASADTRAMTMSLAGIDAFPTLARPRILHLGVDGGVDCELLQDRIERGGEQLGFPPEGRPFRPHVTLGRVREGHRLPDDWREPFRPEDFATAFVADRVVLFESRQSADGPEYSVHHEIRLS